MTSTIFESALKLSGWVELSILGKATILLMLGLLAARLAGRARASVRHLQLAATFATLLALPLIVLTAPGVTIEVPVSHVGESVATSTAASPLDVLPPANTAPAGPSIAGSRWTPPSWPVMLRWGWIAGALLLFASLGRDLWRRRPIRRDGLPCPEMHALTQSLAAECGVRRSVEILLHEDIAAPLTFGFWHPAIVLPSDAPEWGQDDLHRALVHELEHVRRGDWAIQLAARAACACYWFHPLMWMAWRGLCLGAERACDDAVIVREQPTEYAGQLVLLARRMSKPHTQPALGMANRSDLSTRVSALLDSSQRRGRVGLVAAVSAIAVASLVVLGIAPVRAVAQSATSARRPAALDRALYDAAENGDLAAIAALLNAGGNVNCTLPGDGTPLIGAARRGHLEAVRLLLDRGANPNLPVRGDGNPLIMAARDGHVDVVTLLLDRGALIDEMVPEDENALIQASERGRLEVVKLLVARHANVNARAWAESASDRPDGEWRTPLSMARKGGHDTVVTFLLASGARE